MGGEKIRAENRTGVRGEIAVLFGFPLSLFSIIIFVSREYKHPFSFNNRTRNQGCIFLREGEKGRSADFLPDAVTEGAGV